MNFGYLSKGHGLDSSDTIVLIVTFMYCDPIVLAASEQLNQSLIRMSQNCPLNPNVKETISETEPKLTGGGVI